MRHIFLSYSRKDEAFVSAVADELRKASIPVWQDLSDIPHSTEWFQMIEEALYTASAAIIFDSDAWHASAPCHKEYEIIEQLGLPYLNVDPSDNAEHPANMDDVINICGQMISRKENNWRVQIMSGTYRVMRGKPYQSLLPKAKNVFEANRLLNELHSMKEDIQYERESKERSTEFLEAMEIFVQKSRRSILGASLRRLAIGCIFIVGFFATWIMAYMIPQLQQEITRQTGEMDSYQTLISARGKSLSEIEDLSNSLQIGDSMAVRGMAILMADSYPVETVTARQEVDALRESMQNLQLTSTEPNIEPIGTTEVKESDSGTEDEDVLLASGSKYEVTVNSETGLTSVAQKAKEDGTEESRSEEIQVRTIELDGAPALGAMDDSETYLALAYEDQIYLTLTDMVQKPIRLAGCNGEVKALYLQDDTVYAGLADGELQAWEIPWKKKTVFPEIYDLSGGSIGNNDQGEIVAAFVSDGKAVISIQNEPKIISEGLNTLDGEFSALSEDGSVAAFHSYDSAIGSSCVYIISCGDGTVLQKWETTGYLYGMTFHSGRNCIAVCGSGARVLEGNLDTKEWAETEQSDQYYSITPYEQGYVCGSVNGQLGILDQNLRETAQYLGSDVSVPVRQVKVSRTTESAYVAGRGGATLLGQCVTRLQNGARHRMVPLDDPDSVSTNSVAVSQSGELVAYGHSDGTLSIWEGQTTNLRWVNRSIPEAILDVIFLSNDQALIVLGVSGNCYCVDLPGYVTDCAAGDAGGQREAMEIQSNNE